MKTAVQKNGSLLIKKYKENTPSPLCASHDSQKTEDKISPAATRPQEPLDAPPMIQSVCPDIHVNTSSLCYDTDEAENTATANSGAYRRSKWES